MGGLFVRLTVEVAIRGEGARGGPVGKLYNVRLVCESGVVVVLLVTQTGIEQRYRRDN
jgi:sporulation protein YlmC with PRC-barrel domain